MSTKFEVKQKITCFHCGDVVRTDKYILHENGEELHFCCNGCYQAYQLINDYGLGSYYKNREDFGEKPTENYELSVFEVIDQKIPIIKKENQTYKEKSFYIFGLHCASCVWLNEKVLSQLKGVIEVRVNFSNNRVYLKWNPELISLKEIAEQTYRIGYKIQFIDENIEKSFKNKSDSLLKKMAVAGFFTGNNMMISMALYAGYFDYIEPAMKQFFHFFSFLFATPVLIYSASEFFRNSYYSLKHKVLSMDILTATGISLAYFYSVWVTFSFQINHEVYFDAVCFVVFAILTGRFIESRLKLKTYYYITNLGSIIPSFVRKLKDEDSIRLQNINENHYHYEEIDLIQVNDIVVVFPEEIVPLDGLLLNDVIEVDEASITGEYTPVVKKTNDFIVSGSKNVSSQTLFLRVVKTKNESTISEIIKLSESSLKEKSKAETIANKTANIFIFFVLVLSIITFVYWYFYKNQLESAILNTLSLLIVACPCALSLSIPTAFVVAIQKLFSNGCLFKTTNTIELLSKTRNIAFDKTGTLTQGKLEVEKVYSFVPKENLNQLINIFNRVQRELMIQHPITKAFFKLENQLLSEISIEEINTKKIDIDLLFNDNLRGDYIAGKGVVIAIDDKKSLFLGSKEFIENLSNEFIKQIILPGRLMIYLGIKQSQTTEILAVFLLRDSIRNNAKEVLNTLNQKYNTFLLTGDTEENAKYIQNELKLKEIYYSLKPEEKAKVIQNLQKSGITIMVGDGINDTVALNQADVGISFADASKLAMYSSDILLLNPNLEYINYILNFSKQVIKKIKQNLIISFLYNILLLPLAFIGFLNPFIGSVFMSLSSITVVLNSLTLIKYNK
jgi:heavy metal translocating P-type ATPase